MNKRIALQIIYALSGGGTNYPQHIKTGNSLSDGKQPKPQHQSLKTFRIKGKEIQAYSKKDAIKRLKHQKS